MRRDPLYFAFAVSCASAQDTKRVVAELHRQIAPTAELIDNHVSSEGTETVHHRIGEFFDDIAIHPDVNGTANHFRLVFHRRADAGRYWKDLMIRIVRALESEQGVSVSLDYQGDDLLGWMHPMVAS